MISPYIQTSDYYFIWKPHHIPSSFWKEKSFLEYLSDNQIQTPEIIFPDDVGFFLEENFPIKNYQSVDIDQIIKNLKSEFTSQEEYWLLNRLDNETAGYLYFAKTRQIYEEYKNSQKQWILEKTYLAQVYWNPFFKSSENFMIIDYPIMHHKSDEKRMLAIKTQDDKEKWRWQIKQQKTRISLIQYDSKTNISSLAVSISKWVRHQIRLHLASIWSAIVWDDIYGKKTNWFLCLWSLWFQIKIGLTNDIK